MNQSAALLSTAGLAQDANVNGFTNKNTGAKQFALGAQYAFSERTQLYGYYVKLDNKSKANFYLVNGTPTGQDNSGITIGLKHYF